MMTLLLVLALVAQDDNIQNLNHRDPAVRRSAAVIFGRMNQHSAIPALIELLKDETDPDVRGAVVEALGRLTSQNFADSHADWRRWWDGEGRARYPQHVIRSEEINRLLQPQLGEFDRKLEKASKDIDKRNAEHRFLSGVTVAVAILFMLVMFFFVGHVSSRMKAWKGLVVNAEVYVKRAEEITNRIDHVIAELEAKKADILAFIGKAREDGQGEMERYSDMLQKNLEHKMREDLMALRQKAEKELQQTLGELRTQIDVEARRVASEQREKSEKVFQGQRDAFLKEVEAQTLFLEAGFAALHGKPEEALRHYRRLVALTPGHATAWTAMGTVLRDLGRYDESLEAYQKALEHAPNTPAILYNVAATYARMRKKEKMLEALALAIANDGEVKDEALNDPAFREYWNDPAFKDIAEG